MNSRILCILALVCFCISGIAGYTVTGNKIYGPDGKLVTIRGINRPSFEWNILGERASKDDYTLMKNWGANVIRIPMNQDFWLAGPAYQNTIDQQVQWITSLGMGVILDLHWNNGAQQLMADQNSITFWKQVAAKYKANAWIIFELYNEPQIGSWSVWRNGDGNWAGMQQMLDAIRGAGANNMVLAGGINWAFDLSGVSSGYALTGTNIGYATHPYDYAGKQIADWDKGFGALAATYPIVMTEFGQYCATNTYVADLLKYAESKGIHWTAWAWYVNGCSFPSIISDWNGTPSDIVGVLVKQYLSGTGPSSSSSSGSSSGTNTVAPTIGATAAPAGSAKSVFTDSLVSGWESWSWGTPGPALSDATYKRTGSFSIKMSLVSNAGVYLRTSAGFAVSSYSALQFYVNGGPTAVAAGNLQVQLYSTSAALVGNAVTFPTGASANQWTLVSIDVSRFGVSASTQISGFAITNPSVLAGLAIWLDDISFVVAGSTAAPVTVAPTVTPTPVTVAPTTTPKPTVTPTVSVTPKPVGGCDASSVKITQTVVGTWSNNGQTVTQYSVDISHTCAGKTLTGVKFAASNWKALSYWNVVVGAASGSQTVLAMPSYGYATATQAYNIGYQNNGPAATFTVTEATFN